MFKSLFRFIRFTIVGFVWSYAFISFAAFVMFKIWKFNILSGQSWRIISNFWNSGGSIQAGKDYIFLIMLITLPFVWVWGWRYFSRISYLNILLYPINAYNRHIIKKYGHNSPRIVLKNIKSSQKMIEDIKSQLESIKPEKTQQVHNIRQEINQILSNEIKKD